MERRKHKRARLAFPIRICIPRIEPFTEEYASDLSSGGMFLRLNSPLDVGTKLEVEFYLEPAKKVILTRMLIMPGQLNSKQGGEADTSFWPLRG